MMQRLASRCFLVMVIVALPGVGCTETTNSPSSTTSGNDQSVRLDGASQQIKPPTWTIKHRVRHDSGVTTVAMHPSGSEVAAGGILSPLVSIWDVGTGRLIRHIKGLKGGTQALAYSSDGKTLAVGRGMITARDTCVFIFQAGTDKILQRLSPPPIATHLAPAGVGMVESLQYSPDSQFLTVTFNGGGIGIYEVATGQLVKRKTVYTPSFGAVAYSPNGKYLAFGQWKTSEDDPLWNHAEIQLLDTSADGDIIKTFPGHTDLITALAFDPRGKFLASGSNTGQIKGLLDRKTNQMVQKRNDDPIRLWDVAAGTLVKELAGHSGHIKSLMFIEEGHLLVSGSHDKTIKIWDVAEGTVLSTLTDHGDFVAWVAGSRNAKYFVSGGGEAEIKIWQRD